MTCELCGELRIVFLTLLRAPWSDEIVKVKACNECSARAWRTIEGVRVVPTLPIIAICAESAQCQNQ